MKRLPLPCETQPCKLNSILLYRLPVPHPETLDTQQACIRTSRICKTPEYTRGNRISGRNGWTGDTPMVNMHSGGYWGQSLEVGESHLRTHFIFLWIRVYWRSQIWAHLPMNQPFLKTSTKISFAQLSLFQNVFSCDAFLYVILHGAVVLSQTSMCCFLQVWYFPSLLMPMHDLKVFLEGILTSLHAPYSQPGLDDALDVSWTDFFCLECPSVPWLCCWPLPPISCRIYFSLITCISLFHFFLLWLHHSNYIVRS